MSAIVNDLAILLVFLLIGFALRELIKPLQKLFIPASVLGGLVALIVGPQVLGLIELPETLSGMPGPMIVLVLTLLIFIFGAMGYAVASGTAVISVLFSVFMLLIDVLVSFIQAYVFTMLSTIFISLAQENPHEEPHVDPAK